jgi:hypothetical protein
MISSNHVINPGIYRTMPYDTLKDITPIAVLATVPLVLVVNPALPVRDVKGLLAYARANPGKLNYGSAGNGSTLHLAGELLVSETGIDMKHVPYRGTGPLITDMIGGQVQLGFVSISQVGPQVKAGTLRALAVSTSARSAALPDVPTVAEAGVPKYSFDAWIALIGPGGLPKAVVDSDYAAAQGRARVAGSAGGLRGARAHPARHGARPGARLLPGGAGEAPEAGEAVGGDAGLRFISKTAVLAKFCQTAYSAGHEHHERFPARCHEVLRGRAGCATRIRHQQ